MRFRVRFSLRSFLFVVVLTAVVFGVMFSRIRASRRQDAVLAELRSMGIECIKSPDVPDWAARTIGPQLYDSFNVEDVGIQIRFPPNRMPTTRATPTADMLRAELVYVDVNAIESGRFQAAFSKMERLTEVFLIGSGVDVALLEEIAKCPTIKILFISHAGVTEEDLHVLYDMDSVEDVELYDMELSMTGVMHLATLRSLKTIRRPGIPTIYHRVEHVTDMPRSGSLYILEVDDDSIDALASKSGLKTLTMYFDRLSSEGRVSLRQRMPNVNIYVHTAGESSLNAVSPW